MWVPVDELHHSNVELRKEDGIGISTGNIAHNRRDHGTWFRVAAILALGDSWVLGYFCFCDNTGNKVHLTDLTKLTLNFKKSCCHLC